jgi:hypothetical protein
MPSNTTSAQFVNTSLQHFCSPQFELPRALEAAQLLAVFQRHWMVKTPLGLFNASNSALEGNVATHCFIPGSAESGHVSPPSPDNRMHFDMSEYSVLLVMNGQTLTIM